MLPADLRKVNPFKLLEEAFEKEDEEEMTAKEEADQRREFQAYLGQALLGVELVSAV